MTDLIRSSSLVGYQELVVELGGKPTPLLERFHIQPSALMQEDSMIPLRSVINLLEITAKTLNCHDFGLKLAAKQGFMLLGPVALIGLNSPTVGNALKSILKHLDFHCPALLSEIDMSTDPLRPRITFDLPLSVSSAGKQIYEIAIGNIYQELLIMTQGAFVPQGILFRHPPQTSISSYQKYFKTKVYFGQEVNAVITSPEDLAWRIDKANPQLQKLVAEYVRQSSASHPSDISAQVRFLIKRLLPTGQSGLKQVAQNLCMHERTLQRKLSDGNHVFGKILDSVRSERAYDLLSKSTTSISQISASLGYSEQAAFNRACSRWFNLSPMKIRQRTTL